MTTVRQHLPAAETAEPGATRPGGLALVAPAVGAAILVVSRRRASREVLTRIFRSAGMRADAVDSPGVVTALRRGPDAGALTILVIDARRPGADGLGLVARIRAYPDGSTARIVLLVGSGTRGDAARCRDLDVSAYLTKPLCPADVVAAIRTVLELDRQGMAAPLVTRHQLAGQPEPVQVLLAEDDPSIRFLVTRILEKRGHSVVATANGREALAALERGSFDVLLTDVGMPVLDGLGLAKAVREREANGARRLPVVALTGYEPEVDRGRLLDAGIDVCLGKPFIPEDVFFTLEAVTGRSGSREARALSASRAFDRAAIIADVDGDVELLRKMVSLFRESWPHRVTRLRDAIHRRCGRDLAEAAHAVKGSIGIFRAADAFENARRLEFLGRREDFGAAEETLRSLEERVRALQSGLSAFLKEVRK